MTQLVDRLESEGLVRRMADPNDRRSVRAMLTRAGQRRHDQAIQLVRAREAEIVAPLDASDCVELKRLLRLVGGAR
jgi:DNA-binding MarR family transcriptional regulator